MFSTAGAIPVSSGFTWTTAFVGILNLLVGGVLVAIIRSRPALKKIANEREANLLTERAAEMVSMRASIAKLEVDLAVERHKNNNQRVMIYSLLHLFDMTPAKRKEALANIRADLAAMERAEAAEKGAIHAAKITGALE